MTTPVPADDGLRAVLAAAMPDHQHWCHAEAHGDCCRADDCDCGVGDSLDRLESAVRAYAIQYAAGAVTKLKAVPTYALTNDGEPLATVVLADDVLDALRVETP